MYFDYVTIHPSIHTLVQSAGTVEYTDCFFVDR